MARHGTRRARPAELVPGTVRVISARLNYWPGGRATRTTTCSPTRARPSSSRYALGRDYHKVLRARLRSSPSASPPRWAPFGYRVFTDSAPVMEVALAAQAGLGWRGKHTLLLTREAGSYFFLGEIYTDLPLPATPPATDIAAPARAASTSAPPARSSRPTSSTRGAASPTSPSSSHGASPRSCAR